MENIDYAHIFAEIADLLEIQGANPFRVRAYRNAARTLETLPQSVNSLLGEGEKHLEDLPSIGKDLARKIVEIERTGELEFLSNLRQEVPPSLLEILRIPGLGAKRINQMWKSLGIISIDQLEEAAQSGKLDELRGFGETIKASVLKGIKEILKINEYGVFKEDRLVGGETEAEVFSAVEVPWIPPQLRENRGEIEAACQGRLPQLVQLKDIRGDLHMHTKFSDGHHSVEQMVEACRRRKYVYLAITDHSTSVRVAGGLNPEDFQKQFREIDQLQKRCDDIRILKSAEVDILTDGALDLDDSILEQMDVVLVSVHSKFNLTKAEMTRRITKAMRHPQVKILGHPTGRLINQREPYAVDIEELLRVARDEGVLVEANSHPERLDLRDFHLQMAKEAGVKVVISTDSHRTTDLDYMRYGVDQARRGWLEKSDVANTLPLSSFLKLLKK